jgi:succinylarginine dihydrolase
MALKAEQSLLQMDVVMVVVAQQVVVAHKVASKDLFNTEQELEVRLNGLVLVDIPALIRQVGLQS